MRVVWLVCRRTHARGESYSEVLQDAEVGGVYTTKDATSGKREA